LTNCKIAWVKGLEAISLCTFVPQFLLRDSASCISGSIIKRGVYRERIELDICVSIGKSLCNSRNRIFWPLSRLTPSKSGRREIYPSSGFASTLSQTSNMYSQFSLVRFSSVALAVEYRQPRSQKNWGHVPTTSSKGFGV